MSEPFNVGSKHFAGYRREKLHSGNNFFTCLSEFGDYPVSNAKKCEFIFKPGDRGFYEIIIKDDAEGQWENLDEPGRRNPLNMSHESDDHGDNKNNGAFGQGFKSGAMNLGNKLTIYLRFNNLYYEFIYNFINMANQIDAEESWMPNRREINKDEYIKVHGHETGTTMIISELDGCGSVSISDFDEKLEEIRDYLSKTYGFGEAIKSKKYQSSKTRKLTRKAIVPTVRPRLMARP